MHALLLAAEGAGQVVVNDLGEDAESTARFKRLIILAVKQ